jgi:serine/threonine-protein kinase
MVYVADETGRPEVYVSPFPAADRRWQVSTAGGTQPVWSRSGEVFFVAPDRKLIAARVVTDPEFRVEAARALFEILEKSSSSDIPLYDVARDGNRFLVNVPTQEQTSQPLTVVLGWAEGLGRR